MVTHSSGSDANYTGSLSIGDVHGATLLCGQSMIGRDWSKLSTHILPDFPSQDINWQ